jgi:transposase
MLITFGKRVVLVQLPKQNSSPPQSSDVNVNENLWAKLEPEIRNHATSNKDDLKKALRED